MSRRKSMPKSEASPEPQAVAPQFIYEARLGANGAVIRVQPPINELQAIAIRKTDGMNRDRKSVV